MMQKLKPSIWVFLFSAAERVNYKCFGAKSNAEYVKCYVVRDIVFSILWRAIGYINYVKYSSSKIQLY